MGIMKKWRKSIIAVVVFVGILSLATMFFVQKPTEVPISNSTEPLQPASTPIPVETPVAIPQPTQTPQPTQVPQPTQTPTVSPEQTQPPVLSPTMPPEQTQPPTIPPEQPQPPVQTLTIPPEQSQQPIQTPAVPSEEEKSDMIQPEQEDACALGHDFNISVWETATCLKSGYYNNICKRCGLVESVTVEPLPHDVEEVLIQEGNCMQDTIIRHICKSCGQQVQSDTRYTPEVHKWSSTVVDNKEVVYCEWCGIVQ